MMKWAALALIGSIWMSYDSKATGQPSDKAPAVKYRAGKDLSFDEILVQGQIHRPEISVVTGSADEDNNGLVRLRQDFLDQIAADFGEDAGTRGGPQ